MTFTSDSRVFIGLRHSDAAPANRLFEGTIVDARIYSRALSSDELGKLEPGNLSDPKPLAWWDFCDGRLSDRMGVFPIATLAGDAKLTSEGLALDGKTAYLMAARDLPTDKDANATARALREKLLSDPYRPGYHFVIPEGTGMPFDPNGAIYWKGRYHIFYIFQDERGHNWGHVSSADLFHWRHHPTGLIDGMFSGNCFVNKSGVPTMCYHQVDQGNAMAIALDDDLNEWKKLPSNPITPVTKPGDKFDSLYRSWDPYGWIEDGNYYAIFGGERPAVAKSKSLEGPWSYCGDLMAKALPGVSINEDVSCADFFKLGGRRVLLCISHRLGARYYVGEWKNEQFWPEVHEQMSWNDNSFFAPESLLDRKGRRIMWSWIFDRPAFGTRTDFGWSGTMSLPRVLTMGSDKRLKMDVPKEIEALRTNPRSMQSCNYSGSLSLDGIQGNSLELELQLSSDSAPQFGIDVCVSPDGKEFTRINYDRAKKRLEIDATKSSLSEPGTIESAPFVLRKGETLKLRVFIDKSVVEVFANGRQAVMRRIYPSLKSSKGVRLFASEDKVEAKAVKAWDIAPANPY